MKRSARLIVCALGLALALAQPSFAQQRRGGGGSDAGIDRSEDTTRNETLRVVYFPFLALGHGVLLIGKYVIAYPIYYAFKPAYDFLYSSSMGPPPETAESQSGS